MVVASKFHKLVPSCYSCSFALTPYTLNVLNKFLKTSAMKRRKKKIEHDKFFLKT
jgi:hypothetical protein